MRGVRLFWWILPAFLAFGLLALIAAAWVIASVAGEADRARTETELEARARLVAVMIAHQGFPADPAAARDICARLAGSRAPPVTLITASGQAICRAAAADLSRFPEVAGALRGAAGSDLRVSETSGQRTLYVAVPVFEGGAVAGAVRTSDALAPRSHTAPIFGRIFVLGLILAALAAALAFRTSRRLSRPLGAMDRELRRHEERGGRPGEHPLRPRDPAELASLAETVNRLIDQYERRLESLTERRNEQDAVFAGMVEAVIAVDRDKRILNMNDAGARLLAVDPEEARGRNLLEVVRNPDLIRFVERALAGDEPLEQEIELHEPERVLRATGNVLRGRDGRRIGALVVLNDITRLRRLESMRRDFVANVSHELKTPITSIKGFVETLQEGALEDKETAERFLAIVARHVERLSGIVEDLLELSRIERDEERGTVDLEPMPLAGVLRQAVENCRGLASEKKIQVDLECDETLIAAIDPPMLESAVANLVDNALKHGGGGGRVLVAAERRNGEIAISIRDWGEGIPPAHLSRLFERFYRVDAARSRKAGGTGLGLAIVKHIVQAHGGRVTVESRPGEGSTFSLFLPADRGSPP